MYLANKEKGLPYHTNAFCAVLVACNQLTYSSRYSVGSINTPASHEGDTATKVLNSPFLILDSKGQQRDFTIGSPFHPFYLKTCSNLFEPSSLFTILTPYVPWSRHRSYTDTSIVPP